MAMKLIKGMFVCEADKPIHVPSKSEMPPWVQNGLPHLFSGKLLEQICVRFKQAESVVRTNGYGFVRSEKVNSLFDEEISHKITRLWTMADIDQKALMFADVQLLSTNNGKMIEKIIYHCKDYGIVSPFSLKMVGKVIKTNKEFGTEHWRVQSFNLDEIALVFTGDDSILSHKRTIDSPWRDE